MMAESNSARRLSPRKRSSFTVRSTEAADSSVGSMSSGNRTSGEQNPAVQSGSGYLDSPYGPRISGSPPAFHRDGLAWELFRGDSRAKDPGRGPDANRGQSGSPSGIIFRRMSLEVPRNLDFLDKKVKPEQVLSGSDQAEKLGTFSGVFVPTTLNVLSILMFLRFGFILGQSGVLGMMGMLISSYLINLVTTMSISAIATNGTVRGGGAYYLISRSLGPEFGGSIGIVFYLGSVFNTGMNAVGLVDCLTQSFGSLSGEWSNFLLEGFWWEYLWGTLVLVLCTAICLAGSSIFARASNGLLAILLVATYSIPLSAVIKKPFTRKDSGIEFTGFSAKTFMDNLKPRLTHGAAGSMIPGQENFQDLFGILFPATGGIFAGASMSGDLKNPSESIPQGTLYGLGTTFFTYAVVILAMASTVTRKSLYNDVNIIQDTNISGILVLLGEFATTFFSALMGVIGSAKLLQAMARDALLPGLSVFGRGTQKNDEPINAILFTFVVAQLTMMFDINRIASFITMTYLMTFLVTNLACFLLKIGSAPNFRPSFHYFNSWTALAGTLISGATMFFVDGIYASACVCILVILFVLIHYTTPPKTWGDVSQSLIYHQVRKYLLRLRSEHVKFWRPQILLFVNDFDAQYRMIHFCNSLKKGALFVLGHVIVSQDFAGTVPEVRRQQAAWAKFIEFARVKAFVNISVSPSAEWGVRNMVLISGLGGMRPNIVVIDQFRKKDVLQRSFLRRDSKGAGQSLDSNSGGGDGRSARKLGASSSKESGMSVQSYLTILEDLLFKLRINVAVAKGFEMLELPVHGGRNTKRFIDLWPIQMSAEIVADGSKQNLLTTNFDTYTLILQLGCILHTVPSWKKSYSLRVVVFVEYETDVEEEHGRVQTLLEKLRIEAEILVFWLASGNLKSYGIIVNGEESDVDQTAISHVESVLKYDSWWQGVRKFREGYRTKGKPGQMAKPLGTAPIRAGSSFQQERHNAAKKRFDGLKTLIESSKRRKSIGSFGGMGVSLGMQTHRLLDSMVQYQTDVSDELTSDESDTESRFSESEDDTLGRGSKHMSLGAGSGGSSTVEASEGSADLRKEGSQTSAHKPRAQRRSAGVYGTLKAATLSDSAIAADSSPSDSETVPPVPRPVITMTDEGQVDKTPKERPAPPRSTSTSRFSSSPIPETKVATDEGSGPSIMFAPTVSSKGPSAPHQSIYSRPAAAGRASSAVATRTLASGFPSQASIPLSFNDLPCRAQHLILNELMRAHSQKTAVIFTTLPSPIEGTCRDEGTSEAYVSDLDVLCDGLPPCLLVHSNSMTVTMNL